MFDSRPVEPGQNAVPPRWVAAVGGNCTHNPDDATFGPHCGFALFSGPAQEKCREDAALPELVANWQLFQPSVRSAIMALALGC